MNLSMTTSALVVLLSVLTRQTFAGDSPGQPLPVELNVPSGEVLVQSLHGTGAQVYQCIAAKDNSPQFSWTLKTPDAVLTAADGKTLGKHYAGPTWEAMDGSKVAGEVTAKVDSPDTAAIPWLLLRAKSASATGTFSGITSIQRINTVGGKAPGEGCDSSQSGTEIRVAYSADYRFYAASPASPRGFWKTIDDKTGKPRAIVHIYEQGGKLYGRIEHTFTPGGEHRVCVPCTDDRKDKPIVGLLIMRNMQSDGDEFVGGDILDPESGSVYRCKMHLEEHGARLILRGYIGISLLGRSQTWVRVNYASSPS